MVVNISEKGRNRLRFFLYVLHSVQLMFGIIFLLISCLFLFTFVNHLHRINKQQSTTVSLFLLAVGLKVIFNSIIGYQAAKNFCKIPPPDNIEQFQSMCIVFDILTIILLLSFVFTLRETLKVLLQEISDAFLSGISMYMSDNLWKDTFDHFQTNLHCCGLQNYTDWYKIAWLSSADLPEVNKVKCSRADGQLLLPLAPRSCCRKLDVDKNSSCSIDAVTKITQNQSFFDTDYYNEGCISRFHELFSYIGSVSTVIAMIFIITLIPTIICKQYLYTSARNTLIRGIPYGTAPGWLLGRGKRGILSDKPFDLNEEPHVSKKYSKESTIIMQNVGEFQDPFKVTHNKSSKNALHEHFLRTDVLKQNRNRFKLESKNVKSYCDVRPEREEVNCNF